VSMPGDAGKALALLNQALALQPDYAAAHASAAWCYEQRYLRGGLRDEDRVAGLYHARAAIEAGADIVLLDNMKVDEIRRCVELVDGRAILEASGATPTGRIITGD